MSYFWVQGPKGSGTTDAKTADEARERYLVEKGVAATRADTLPYPRSPQLVKGENLDCPPFCYRGDVCLGRGSCPGNPSCTE